MLVAEAGVPGDELDGSEKPLLLGAGRRARWLQGPHCDSVMEAGRREKAADHAARHGEGALMGEVALGLDFEDE